MLGNTLIVSSVLIFSITGLHCDSSNGIPSYDTIVLAQRWSRSECCVVKRLNTTDPDCSRCKAIASQSKWTIHGLWPVDSVNRSEVSYCPNPLVNIKFKRYPADLLSIMRDTWPDTKNPHRDQSFWWREWNKHGTCARDIKGMGRDQNYFRKAIELYDSRNVELMLSRSSISHKNRYSQDKIIEAVRRIVHKTPDITCDIHKGASYLLGIHFCFDKQFIVKDCNSMTNCHPTVFYP